MVNFWLTPEQLAELRAAHRSERNKHAAYKINAVILLGSGWRVNQVKEALGSFNANWGQNSSLLRQEMSFGNPKEFAAESWLGLRSRNHDVVPADRAISMRFAEAARQAFLFLEQAGFRLTQRGSMRLEYESDHAVVIIQWDPRSGELEAFTGLPSNNGVSQEIFSLSDLLNMQGVDAPKRRTPFQVANEDQLAPFLERLAEDVRTRARSALEGDRMFFRQLETFRSAQSRAYLRYMELSRVRSEADQAWLDRDLKKLISLYTSIQSELSE